MDHTANRRKTRDRKGLWQGWQQSFNCFPVSLDFTKNMKYAVNEKFIWVSAYQKLSK